MNNPTHIVISDDFIQEVQAWKNKYWFNGSQQALDEYKASLPTIQRADDGKWTIGQGLRIGVDFSLWYQSPDGGCMYSFLEIKDHEQFDLFKPTAIPIEQSQPTIKVVPEQPKAEPCIIQSAFQFDNGRRIIVYTGSLGIKSFECDENWKPCSKPFGECPLEWSGKTATEYHLHLRNVVHKKEDFVPEHSTVIDWVAIPIEQQGSNPDNELIDFANAISMKAFAELAEQQEQPTPQAEEEEVIKRWLTGIIRSNGSETDVFKAAKCLKELLIRKNEL